MLMNGTRKVSAASRTVGMFEAVEPRQFALFSGEFLPKEQAPLFVGRECLKPGVRVGKAESK